MERQRCSFPFLSSEGLWRCLWKCTALSASGDGFGSFYMSPPHDRAVFAWHTKMVSESDWHEWGSRIKNYRGNFSSYEEDCDSGTLCCSRGKGSWLWAAGYWQLSNIILIVIKISITCSSGNRGNSPDGKDCKGCWDTIQLPGDLEVLIWAKQGSQQTWKSHTALVAATLPSGISEATLQLPCFNPRESAALGMEELGRSPLHPAKALGQEVPQRFQHTQQCIDTTSWCCLGCEISSTVNSLDV